MNMVAFKTQYEEIPFQLQTSVDLSDINNENLLNLKLSHAAFKTSQKKLADELFISCQQMHLMQEILGPRIFKFADEEFGINPRTVRRYLHSYKMLNTHFLTDGRINLQEVRQFTQTALQLLAEDTNEDVILEIRNIAAQGGAINEATVKQLLDQQSGDYEARLNAAQAESTAFKKELKIAEEKHELALSRAEKSKNNSQETERRLEAQLKDLELENEKLQKASIQVQHVEVEKIPAGYSSIEDAVAEATRRHEELTNKITSIRGELALIAEEKATIQNNFNVLTVSLQDVEKFKSDIENAFLKMPHSRIVALSNTDKGITTLLTQLGEELISRGQLLCSIK
jgi:hypothetical protein